MILSFITLFESVTTHVPTVVFMTFNWITSISNVWLNYVLQCSHSIIISIRRRYQRPACN